MFEQVPVAPPDAILGITEAFNKDPNPAKVNLSVGVYKDESGKTPVLAAVKTAEERILGSEGSKNYAPIEGDRSFAALMQELVLGPAAGRGPARAAATAHTPGGTGALRVAADTLRKLHPAATVWVSDPTWPNHPQIFQAAGLAVKAYPYFDAARNTLAFDAMLAALDAVPAGDVVLLHGCCHNPTGIDPTVEQWEAIAAVVARKGLLPLVDFAYQGFGDGLDEDARGVRTLLRACPELLICSSLSKNFGLYNERVGTLTVVAALPDQAAAVLSQVKTAIRANYSNPPAHGAAIVTTILSDPDLRAQWETELAGMRQRINGMRRLFAETLAAKGVRRDMSFIVSQRGMFSFSGLSKDQVEALRRDSGVYIVGNGRINVAGMTRANMDALCGAIAKVLQGQ